MKNCLVLGGSGFVGSALVKKLLSTQSRVRVLSRFEPHAPSSEIDYFVGSFLDEGDIKRALADIEVCFHLGWTTTPASSNADILYDLSTNLQSMVRIIQACIDQSVQRLVFVSSGGTVYGATDDVPIKESHKLDPLCAYGVTKVASELYLSMHKRLYGLDYRVLRLSNPFGPGQSLSKQQGVIPLFMSKIAAGTPIEIWGDGSVVRDYIYVEDAVDAISTVACSVSPLLTFNVGSGIGISLNQLIQEMEDVVKKKAIVKYLPSRKFDVPKNVLDRTALLEQLGWKPKFSLREGIESTWRSLMDSSKLINENAPG
jgi:UDP-glucose 4-epimerase